jgi:hypothetical protein
MSQAASAVQRILLFPTLPPEEDELADKKILIFNAVGCKLLPALGSFHLKLALIFFHPQTLEAGAQAALSYPLNLKRV